MVNCQGISGRLRIIMADKNYKPFNFNPSIRGQLMKITKNIKGLEIIKDPKSKPRDYYMYLSFKLEDGNLKAILP